MTTQAILEHFPAGMVTFVNPTCGMFVWLNFQVPQTSFELFQLFADAGVITVPGVDFYVPGVDGVAAPNSSGASVRLTFAASSPSQIRKAIKDMADCLHKLAK